MLSNKRRDLWLLRIIFYCLTFLHNFLLHHRIMQKQAFDTKEVKLNYDWFRVPNMDIKPNSKTNIQEHTTFSYEKHGYHFSLRKTFCKDYNCCFQVCGKSTSNRSGKSSFRKSSDTVITIIRQLQMGTEDYMLKRFHTFLPVFLCL